ncbi:MAG: caspase family protein [Pseudomonadota bacterium]
MQRCYAKLGYYKGPITGKANKATWTAHWLFKNEYGLKAYGNFLDKPVLAKVDELCREQPDESVPSEARGPKNETLKRVADVSAAGDVSAASSDQPSQGTADEADVPAATTSRAGFEITCLPADLIDRLRQAHGADVTAKACAPACLPAPGGLSQKQLDDLYGRYGVVWCRSCVQITGHLSLDDVWKIEQAGDIELCTTPPSQMPRPGSASGNVVKSFSRVRELYRSLPVQPEDENAIAVIIGNAEYDHLPASRTAKNDAGAMYFFLTEHMGFRQDYVIDLRNAVRADFDRVFGPVPGSDGELKRLVQARPNAKVVVYYAGHGATNAAQNETYLMPVDAEAYREERGGYPLSTLYTNLAALGADQVLVLLESSFGRDHGAYILPPNIPETKLSALPPAPEPNLTVLISADRGQRALMDPEHDVGLFTRYLIEGLASNADLAPVGNGNGKVDCAELYAYTAAMVRLAAQKTYGLLQNPVLSTDKKTVLKAPVETDKSSEQG